MFFIDFGMASRINDGTRLFRLASSPCTEPCTAALPASRKAEPADCIVALLALLRAEPAAWAASLASLKACDTAPVSCSAVKWAMIRFSVGGAPRRPARGVARSRCSMGDASNQIYIEWPDFHRRNRLH